MRRLGTLAPCRDPIRCPFHAATPYRAYFREGTPVTILVRPTSNRSSAPPSPAAYHGTIAQDSAGWREDQVCAWAPPSRCALRAAISARAFESWRSLESNHHPAHPSPASTPRDNLRPWEGLALWRRRRMARGTGVRCPRHAFESDTWTEETRCVGAHRDPQAGTPRNGSIGPDPLVVSRLTETRARLASVARRAASVP